MSTQVAPSPQKIMQFAFGFVPSLAVSAGVKLRVFEGIAAGHKTVAQLCEFCDCAERGLQPLLHTLASLEMVSEEGGQYSLALDTQVFLVPSSPAYLGGVIAHQTAHIAQWEKLSEVVRTGQHVGPSVEGDDDNGAFFAGFVDSLFNLNWPTAQAVAEHLGQPKSALDIGAGSGVWSLALAARVPDLKVTAVDRKLVLEVTRKFAQKLNCADRYMMKDGNFRDVDFGQDHNVVFLGHILHSEGRNASQILLERCYRALKPGGVLVVAEMVAAEQRPKDVFTNLFDLNMLMWTEEGTVFSGSELEAMGKQAGFSRHQWIQTKSPSPILLAHK